MIFVDRSTATAVPADWPGREAAEARIAGYNLRLESGPDQFRLDFNSFLPRFYRAHRSAVTTLFRNKCAYCESLLGVTGEGDMELFRPKQAASELTGEGSIGHYGWLSIVWDNLYIACRACNASKKNLFPVDGKRAEIGSSLKLVRETESALLIDPCYDQPSDHLLFLDDGQVKPLTRRGETTIMVLRLNRQPLLQERRALALRLAKYVDEIVTTRGRAGVAAGELVRSLKPEAPYIAMARAYLVRQRERLESLWSPPSGSHYDFWKSTARASARPEARAFARGGRRRVTREEHLRLAARPLKQVTLTNFKMLRNLTLDFPEPGEQAPWLVLLGENATGKSAALLGIALALAGADAANRHLHAETVLHRDADEGRVELGFWDSDEKAVLTFSRGKRFAGTTAPSVLVLAYGPLRIPGRERARGSVERDVNSHLSGITGRFAQLPNPQPWLRRLRGQQFDAVARVLKTVLPVHDDDVVYRSGGRIRFRGAGSDASLDELSAGYGAIVAMAVDILTVLLDRWQQPEAAEGFVIIDELESHLHPRWKMRIADAFRRSFPRVQFLISTHDPLILRGVKNGEVRLMRRHKEAGAVAIDQLPNIEGLRVDQLLTSEYFGLSSTIDPALESAYERYYHLLSLTGPTEEELVELDGLREELDQKGELGHNPRERLMYQAIDEFLAHPVEASTDRGGDLLSQELQRLWDEA
ncbi:MAG TPA: AAA family ATPase [Allosphingosinicella sp.]|nr:AAA family ATPase [Allosphingosinicella sp.]